MKKIFIIFGCFLISSVLLLILLNPSSDKSKGIAADTSKEETQKNLVYVIKGYNGNIAVFEENSDTPFKVTDIRLSELPEGDKKLLSEGIHASNFQELNCILEDYCS